MTQDIEISVRSWGYGESHVGYPPRSLEDAIRQFQETLLEIPEEHRPGAVIDFSPVGEYGEYFERVRITYDRPETPAETEARVELERAAMATWIAEQEALIRRRKQELGI